MNKTKYILLLALLVIIAGGVFAWQKGYLNNTLKQSTQNKNETADWQTYRNEKHGFEIEVPLGWYIREEGDIQLTHEQDPYPIFLVVNLYPPGESGISIKSINGDFLKVIEQVKKNNQENIFGSSTDSHTIFEEVQTTFQGKPAYIVYNFSWPECFECGVGKSIYIEKSPENVLVIDVSLAFAPRGPSTKENIDKFGDKIISTIRFFE